MSVTFEYQTAGWSFMRSYRSEFGTLSFTPEVPHQYRVEVSCGWSHDSCRIVDVDSKDTVAEIEICRGVEPRGPVEAVRQERLFMEAEAEGTIEAYERFLELDTWGGILAWEAKRRIGVLSASSSPIGRPPPRASGRRPLRCSPRLVGGGRGLPHLRHLRRLRLRDRLPPREPAEADHAMLSVQRVGVRELREVRAGARPMPVARRRMTARGSICKRSPLLLLPVLALAYRVIRGSTALWGGGVLLLATDGLGDAPRVLWGNGDGTFQAAVSFPVGDGPAAIASTGPDGVAIAPSTSVPDLGGRCGLGLASAS